MINLRALVVSILIPLAFGFIGNLLGGGSDSYQSLILPDFAPPGFIFGIVWPILYILMGISSYIIKMSCACESEKISAQSIYFVQLILNSLWSLFFFRFEMYLFSFIWILLIILAVIVMIYKFHKISPTAAYLQIPYLLWLIFAAILNYSIYTLNM